MFVNLCSFSTIINIFNYLAFSQYSTNGTSSSMGFGYPNVLNYKGGSNSVIGNLRTNSPPQNSDPNGSGSLMGTTNSTNDFNSGPFGLAMLDGNNSRQSLNSQLYSSYNHNSNPMISPRNVSLVNSEFNVTDSPSVVLNNSPVSHHSDSLLNHQNNLVDHFFDVDNNSQPQDEDSKQFSSFSVNNSTNQICRYYSNGNCMRGDRCNYLHVRSEPVGIRKEDKKKDKSKRFVNGTGNQKSNSRGRNRGIIVAETKKAAAVDGKQFFYIFFYIFQFTNIYNYSFQIYNN